MGWSEVVHESRKAAELQRAREELRLRRRGHAVEEKPTAEVPAVLALAGVLTAAAWWRREARKVNGRSWRSLPGLSQLLDILHAGKQPKRTAPRRASKPTPKLAPPSKAAAARQAAGRPSGPARASSSGGGAGGSNAAAAAAGAAALMRASGGPSSSGGGAAAQQQQVVSSSAAEQGPQQSKPKKKKNKKKK